ncbi:BPSS1780 family membrane protein [Propionivibrio limicola]|uniref:BPSS1780 family membrane protein n=1 Tax=Propionivibrio limicola TaxID=167645 RepID=UPI001291DE6D|nr:BPSS1780 family membrane protein [Propionivibrio limicola]
MDPFPIQAPAFNGESRVVEAGSAFEWLRQGWGLFATNPGMWIAMTVVLLVIFFGLQIVPFVGSLAAHLLTPVLLAGLLQTSRRLESGEMPEIADLFVGFKQQTGSLVTLGVLYMAAMLVILLIGLLLGGGSLAGGMMMGRPAGFGVAMGGMMLTMLVSLLLSVPVLMALWFAPALVLFNRMPPVDAAKASFNACLKNLLPFIVYGLMLAVLMFFAALPVLLGFLVLIPVIAGSVYAAYRDIFVAL